MHFLLDKGYFMLACLHYPKPHCFVVEQEENDEDKLAYRISINLFTKHSSELPRIYPLGKT